MRITKKFFVNFLLSNLNDVQITSIADGDSLRYSSALSKWINIAIAARLLEASATADATTTSATDVLMTGMQLVNPPAGVYFVEFSGSFDHSNQSVPITFSIYVGGSQLAHTVRTCTTRTNAIGANSCTQTGATNAKVTVNGSQNIEIRWNRGSAGTGTVHQRTLNADLA